MEQEKRKKVVRWLQICINGCDDSCPYKRECESKGGFIAPMADALALLKAQEPVKPVMDIDTWKCWNCGHTLEYQELLGDNVLFYEQYNYCPECGRAVKWK